MPTIPIASTRAEDLVKIIRILAMTGKSVFVRYLRQPLEMSKWRPAPSSEPLRRAMDRVDAALRQPSSQNTAPVLLKQIICHVLCDSHSAVGDAVIYFLENIARYSVVAASSEAAYLIEVIGAPLAEFQKLQTGKVEQLFSDHLRSFEPAEIVRAFEPVKLGAASGKVELTAEMKVLYNKILVASRQHDIGRCLKLISAYLIRYADAEIQDNASLERLINALEAREPAFRKMLNEYMAINLYFEIQQGIGKGELGRTIRAIRKYAYVFEGNPAIKYHFEIDRLERILYGIMSEKNLWSRLEQTGGDFIPPG